MTTELKLAVRGSEPVSGCDEQAVDLLFSKLAALEEDLPMGNDVAPQVSGGPTHIPPLLLPRAKRAPTARRIQAPTPIRISDWLAHLHSLLIASSVALALAFLVNGLLGLYHRRDSNAGNRSRSASAAAAAVSPATSKEVLLRKKIQDFQVGERIAGHNPLREQVEDLEPDPATWLKISFRMRQENGLWLWIDLLRPKDWARANGVRPGATIHLDLPEMGAVGDAQVTDFGPCPEVEGGDGTVVTGTFKRVSDGSHVVELRLEGQIEPTGVTDNHPYWSVDRHEFIEVGKLRVGELVDTEFGPRHVESVAPCLYRGYLYNLETTEHVFRVGSLGTLVHNACATKLKKAMNAAGSYGDAGTAAHHIVARNAPGADVARGILAKYGITLDSHWNGVFLPRNRRISSARGVVHEGLDSGAYYREVERRLRAADKNGRAEVLRELQRIRHDLLNGTF